MGRHSGSGAGAAGGGVRRGHVGVGAVVDIEIGALCAFEEEIVSAIHAFLQEDDRVADVGKEALAGFETGASDSFEFEGSLTAGFEDHIGVFDHDGEPFEK